MNNLICEICFDDIQSEKYDLHKSECLKLQLDSFQNFKKIELTSHQRNALKYSLDISKKYSDAEYENVLTMFKNKNLTKNDLSLVVNYIVNIAPVIIHISLDAILEYLCNDIYYRNQFQTSTSNGTLSYETRIGWEANLFGGTYGAVDGFYRVKYGALNFTNDSMGINDCNCYGDSYLILKNEVKNRTTMTLGDSSNPTSQFVGTFEHFYHIINKLPTNLIDKLVKLATGDEVSYPSNYGFYIECQYHGDILLDRDIECLCVNSRHQMDQNISQLLKKLNSRHKINILHL